MILFLYPLQIYLPFVSSVTFLYRWKMNGMVRRRRLKVKTPCIDTYEKQMLQCEKRFNRITLTFPIEMHKSWSHATGSKGTYDSLCLENKSNQECRSYCNKRNNSFRRRSHDHFRFRRKSSLFSRLQLGIPTSEFQDFLNSSPSRGASSLSHNKTSHKSKALSPLKHVGTPSRRVSQVYTPGNEIQPPGFAQKDSNVSPQHTPKIMEFTPYHQEYFIRALTTLAINNLTSNHPHAHERRASHNFYDRNIKMLVDGPNFTLDSNPHPQNQHQFELDRESNGIQSSLKSSISTSEEDGESPIEEDKREKINRLRNYLKCSGLGEPSLLTISNDETEQSRREVLRLVRKVHRGLSPEKQERLRLKTQLEYEMSLMKGESFCEQQDQVFMRTASADMGDRDQQLLEEEMKDQLLQELDKDNEQDHRTNNARQRKVIDKMGPKRFFDRGVRNLFARSNRNGVHASAEENLDEKDCRLLLEGQEDDDDVSSKGDKLSGTLRSPLSRREMRHRILEWVVNVENAMGLEWKERMRINYGTKSNRQEAEGSENDEHIAKVMKANNVQLEMI